jgi:anaerobic magnesium-protoporphyrin IX monomethyl ester cyclase
MKILFKREKSMKIKEIASIYQEYKKLDVVFLHMDTYFYKNFTHSNIGLLYIATVLKNEGYKVKCLGLHEMFKMSHEELMRGFILTRPKIIGFYVMVENYYQVHDFAAHIKKWCPDSTIVVGGPMANCLGEKILENKDFDICVLGEGEYTCLKLADWKIKNEGKLEDIPGIIYRENDKIKKTSPPELIMDLDALPFPDTTLFEHGRWFHIVSGRGCPYNCIFCFQETHGRKYRYRSAENIVEEIIKNIETYNYLCFDIIDDIFVSDHKRVIDIAERLQEYRNRTGKKFLFFSQARIDAITRHPEMLEPLKKAGLMRLQFGFESGSNETLKLYNKKFTVEQTKQAVDIVVKTGEISVVGNFILGGPFETQETLNASLELAEELIDMAPGIVDINVVFMAALKGTQLSRTPSEFGLKIVDDDFKKGLTLSDVSMVSEQCEHAELRGFYRKFINRLMDRMKANVSRIPRSLVLKHFEWACLFSASTYWYLYILEKNANLKNYFEMSISPRFSSFDKIPEKKILEWYPHRIKETREYSPDGKKLILPETTVKHELTDKNEILIYELSSSKMTVDRMLDEFQAEMGYDMTREEIYNRYFVPTFKKLEETFHIIFHS